MGVPNPYFSVHEGLTRDTARIGGRELISFVHDLQLLGHVGRSGGRRRPRKTRSIATAPASRPAGWFRARSRFIASWSGRSPISWRAKTRSAFVGGHSTNESTIGHLFGPGDLIVHDALAHNSIIQGSILSGASPPAVPAQRLAGVRSAARRNSPRLSPRADRHRRRLQHGRRFPRSAAVHRGQKTHKAFMLIDEAHSLGAMGKTGRGIGEHFGIDPRDVDLWMGTLSKSLGSCGGYIAGSQRSCRIPEIHRARLCLQLTGIAAVRGRRGAGLAAACSRSRSVLTSSRQLAAVSAVGSRRRAEHGHEQRHAGGADHYWAIRSRPDATRELFRARINVQPILHPAVEERKRSAAVLHHLGTHRASKFDKRSRPPGKCWPRSIRSILEHGRSSVD